MGEVGASEPLEIHGQEGDVGEHIAVSEMIGEFETIEHAWHYVEFLYLAGTIKAKPRAWHEMFAPMLDDYRSR